MSTRLEIKKFRMQNIRPDATIAIIGRRGSGKTTLNKWILYYLKNRTRSAYVISNTADMNGDYNTLLPDNCIMREFDPARVSKILEMQVKLRDRLESNNINKNTKVSCIIIMDDILSDPKWKNSPVMKEMIMDGRHFFLTNILSVQAPQAIPNQYRENFDYLIITSASNEKYKRFIYDNYINHEACPNYTQFKNIIAQCTAGHMSLLIDNKTMAGSTNLSDSLFYISLPDPIKLRGHSCVSRKFRRACEHYLDRDWKRNIYRQKFGVTGGNSGKNTGKPKGNKLIITG